ncbi:IS1595 family transposase [[Clostridium] innocuum]|uniref:IS1595 family transposase n=1 Tax=Holdemanella porci TaxID=2652276 RepID=UPI002147934E|nr:IS1595 family transposase [[Clostridium] innocuum]MCR0275991.1 IS1595 family transposase [[Clostridium] innocuum]
MLNSSSFDNYVFSLSDEEFIQLKDVVQKRSNKEKYGVTSFEELAIKYNRPILCPNCNSDNKILNGFTSSGKQRYRCLNCDTSYTLLTNSIFNSAKISFSKFTHYISFMSFNVPLEMLEDICEISSNTAMLWRQKVFDTVNSYQDTVILKDTVWIDETYINDALILQNDNSKKKKGLSKQKICIVVAIDCYKNIYASVCGHGKPSKSRIYKTLKDHIKAGSTVIHDGDNAHSYLIENLGLNSQVYIANAKDDVYIEKMALINNLCSWLKRYLYRFVGMDTENLQSYLNWFVYLFRVKREDEKWPKTERIMRHLILNFSRHTRKY